MKVYKHDKYKDAVLLALPAFTNKILGVPYFYSEITQNWERGNIGMSIPYYTQEKLDTMECLGDTGKDWDFITGGDIDASYLIDNRGEIMEILRILTKTLLLLLAVAVAPFTIFFWLFAWIPFTVSSVTLLNLIEFAKGTNEFENYNLIWWFFWLVVMWNEEKAGDYL